MYRFGQFEIVPTGTNQDNQWISLDRQQQSAAILTMFF